MRRNMVLASATLLILLIGVEAVTAQAVFRGGRGRRGASVGVYTPGFSFQYGNPYYGRYSDGRYYDARYYDGYSRPGRDGYYYSRPYSTYYYGPDYYSRPYRSYYYEPDYYYSSTPRYGTTWWGPGLLSTQAAPNGQQPVELRVIVPDPNARVWVEDSLTQQRGTDRLFVSPPLEPGKSFTYNLRASWMENGREVSQERSVTVEAGRRAMVDFTARVERNDDRNTPAAKTHEGLIIRAGDGKLTMTDLDGRNRHTHSVATSAKVQCDGTDCRLGDLREGQRVVVTMDSDEAVRIDARTKE